MLDIYLNLLMMAFGIAIDLFVYAGFILYLTKRHGFSHDKFWRFTNAVWKYSKPLAFIGTFATPVLVVIVDGYLTWHTYFDFAVNVGCLYTFKDAGDDDFTKKLKKKLKEKIEVFRSKLVVVPEAS